MSDMQEQDEMETTEDVAAFWTVRLTSPDCTPEDRHAFESWRQQHPSHHEAYERMARGNAVVDRHAMDPRLQAMAQTALQETEPRFYRKRSWQIAASALAASLLAVVVITAFWTRLPDANGPANIQQITAAPEAYQTEIGEQSTITLADGSKVTLNTDSRIEVDMADHQRGVTLMKGQALFEVVEDANRPFVVIAGTERIVALGTSFDVRLKGDKSVQVTLIEGKVIVNKVSTPSPETAAPPTAKQAVTLAPGEQLTIRGRRGTLARKTDVVATTGWAEGRLVFRQKPLDQVVDELNRYSTQKLKLANDPALRTMKVNGVFNTGRTSSFIDALEAMHPLRAERSGEHELTLVWRR
ncbi:FecR family protein [Parasphingorhabdus cellanae]|uniref:FecR family protein n=1 Tax=Parasphingorhabdus cellanae TaxID=2806553 RepID=A0ABX7T927_9SPHN|nr:FecR family protein [Parasphingorhabdus cellanae]QTD57483.1 FecR family protein [Parasphingorhabdus cellanae]